MGLDCRVRAIVSAFAHRLSGAEAILVYLPCFVPIRHPTAANFMHPQVSRVMLSLYLRLSVYQHTILPFHCRQCQKTMGSECDHSTLNCLRAPCGWVSRQEHLGKIVGREGLRAAGLNCAFEVPMLIHHGDKQPGDRFACLEAPSPSNPVLRNFAMDATILFSYVAAHRPHAAEKPACSSTLLTSRSTTTFRRLLRLRPLRKAPQFRLYRWTSRRYAWSSVLRLEPIL
jgi:hypothetical protein